MRLNPTLLVAAAATILAISPAFAQSTGMKNGSANSSTTKAVCSPGDPNVMVDTKAKTYTLDKAANKTAMAAKNGKSMAASSSMKGDDMDPSGSTTTMKSMCKSEAASMGAKMASGSMKPAGTMK